MTDHESDGPGDLARTVHAAFGLMLTAAALQVLVGLAFVAQFDSFREMWTGDWLEAEPDAPRATIQDVVGQAMITFVVLEIFVAGVWIWMAFMNRAGRNWARITATVLFAISTLGLKSGGVVFARAGYEQRTLTLNANSAEDSLVLNIVTWVLGLVVIVLLWHPRSAAHFRKPARTSPSPSLAASPSPAPPVAEEPEPSGPEPESPPSGYRGGTL